MQMYARIQRMSLDASAAIFCGAEGVGIERPSSRAASIQASAASSAALSASSSVSAAENHPGRSGTTTPHAVRSSPASIRTGYRMGPPTSVLRASATPAPALPQILPWVRNGDDVRVLRVHEYMMGSADPTTDPTCRFQIPDEVPALHAGTIHIAHTPRQSSRRQSFRPSRSTPCVDGIPIARPARSAPPGPRHPPGTPGARG